MYSDVTIPHAVSSLNGDNIVPVISTCSYWKFKRDGASWCAHTIVYSFVIVYSIIVKRKVVKDLLLVLRT